MDPFKDEPLHVRLAAVAVWWFLWFLAWRFGPWNRGDNANHHHPARKGRNS